MLTLNQFRDVERAFRRITRPVHGRRWSREDIWRLWRAIHESVPSGLSWDYDTPEIADPELRHWLSIYRSGQWASLPLMPRSGDGRSDALITIIEDTIRSYIEACRAYGPLREDLRAAFERAGGWQSLGKEADTDSAWSLSSLFPPDTDHWAHQTVTALAQLIERTNALASEERIKVLDHFSTTVRLVIDGVAVEKRIREELEESLREFINLPVWKRRSEIYAVWVASQIMHALDDCDLHYHPEGDVLRFPFSGAHLATIIANRSEVLQFWTELRTPLATPVSGKRKHAIQPDYRVLRMPAGMPEATILVVECKQYRRSGTSNFSAALNDYAAGCQNAYIILVSYGPIGDTVRARIEPDYRQRTVTVEEFRPGSLNAIAVFRRQVRSVIAAHDREASRPVDKSAVGLISLAWGPDLQDLDLHVVVRPRSGGGRHHIHFGFLGSLEEPPYLRLDEDRRAGPGAEQVTIRRWEDAIYEVYVHNYSAIRTLAMPDTTVTVQLHGDGQHFFSCHRVGAEPWWYVCRIDGKTQNVEEVDQLMADLEDAMASTGAI